jgi:hypothetical protein
MSKRESWTPERRAHERALNNERRARDARLLNPSLPPYVPGENPSHLPRDARHGQVRGPAGTLSNAPPISLAEGQELKRQTIHVAPDGTLLDRYDLTQTARENAIAPVVPPAHTITKTTTRIDSDGRVGMQYLTAKPGAAESWNAFWEATRHELADYKGAALSINYPAPADTYADYLSVYWWGDPHIGLLAHESETGAHYDLKIAESELIECFRQLVWKTPPSRVGRLENLGDFWHAETNAQVTPGHGHKLDVDGRAYKVQRCGFRILRSVFDFMKQRHEIVEYEGVPGNHDPNISFQIAAWLGAIYEGDPRVKIFDSIAPYHYREFGQTLIGAGHGDGAKEKDLPLMMAARQREAWGRTRWHQMHCGHIHHTRKIEHSGCLTWYHNTLASKDAWHAWKGYDAEQFLESTTYHERFGPEGSQQVGIERVRAALAAAAGAT